MKLIQCCTERVKIAVYTFDELMEWNLHQTVSWMLHIWNATLKTVPITTKRWIVMYLQYFLSFTNCHGFYCHINETTTLLDRFYCGLKVAFIYFPTNIQSNLVFQIYQNRFCMGSQYFIISKPFFRKDRIWIFILMKHFT